jgi:hypothetical protein
MPVLPRVQCAVPSRPYHLKVGASLKVPLDEVFGTAGLGAWASWCEHACASFPLPLTHLFCHP